MDTNQLANEIASKVVADTEFWIAIIGLIGVVIGSLLTILGNLMLHKIKTKPQKELEISRIQILIKMLNSDKYPDKWRNLTTLSSVIGATDEETKLLLFKAGARGSEKGDGKWGLLKHNPLP